MQEDDWQPPQWPLWGIILLVIFGAITTCTNQIF